MGRRIHDLRHTAACIWLSEGVNLSTVKAWLGQTSVHTTNRYLHHLDTTVDIAALNKLNS
ncbi:tyrosine-type recombinase/integrase [Brevibacterium casei]|uniref:tyrosine-type recombinase/integrase n=1 Tax=Brevibacterium casei TaxID=33889 RepID=UPI0035CD02EE